MVALMNHRIEFETFYNILRDISTSLHSGARIKDVLDTLVTKSAQMLNAKGALVRILNPKTKHLDLGASYGLSDQYLSKGPAFRKEFVMDLCRQNRVLVIRDILNDPFVQYPKEAWEEGIRMMIDAPITYMDDVLGILRIYFDQPREISEDELHYLILIAERGAVVIQRAQLLEMQESRYDQLALQTEKLSALGRMAAGIAHEINNPLAGILLFSSNLLKKAPQEGPFKEGLEIIIQETLRCKAIIQELLEFSRPSEPKMFLTNVNKVIVKAIHLLDNEFRLHHTRLDIDLLKQLPEVLIDENQIEQILINLLLNALQAIEDHGTVAIRSYVTPDRKKVAVDVVDTGCGIAPENMSKIFEPFFSTKPKGTGLGLAVTYGVVQKHGGRVYAFSQPKQGSRFTVELPIPSGPDRQEMGKRT
jgi:signal transduction histidine kinase